MPGGLPHLPAREARDGPRCVPEVLHMAPPDALGSTIRDCLPADVRDGWKEIQRAAEGRELGVEARKA
eukprot:10870053-Lingulodinium_polyedra.AAC.1